MNENISKGQQGEDFVNQLAYKSLLKYWCYPNPIDEKGDKKEIADLLVLFKNICLIITVKNYKFEGDYDRYFKKTVGKAIKQLNGAYRKLFQFPREIFIKHPDRPLERFEKDKYKSVFRIIVNLGEGLDFYQPGYVAPTGEFTTIFDKESFETLLTELDTIGDLTDYLIKREQLLNRNTYISLQGTEKDLIGLFILHGKEFPPEFMKHGYQIIILDIEGQWEKITSEQAEARRKKKEEDEISYIIDRLSEEQINPLPNGFLLSQELLSLNRFARRTLAKVFMDFYQQHHHRLTMATGHRYMTLENIGFVFFYYSPDIVETTMPDQMFQALLIGYREHVKVEVPLLFGIGTTFEMNQFKFGMLADDVPLPNDIVEHTERVIKEMGWFKNVRYKEHKETEYSDE